MLQITLPPYLLNIFFVVVNFLQGFVMISMSTSGDVPEDQDAQISTSVSEVSDGERLIHLTVARLMADDLLPKARKLGCLSSREKFKKMRQDIESVLAEVQNEELDHGSAVVPKVTVAQIRNLLMEELKGYLHENTEHDRFGDIVRTSSGTIMQRRCEQLDTLTLSLLEAYMSSDDEIQSIKHLFAIVQVDVEAWLVSVIPLSSLLCQRSARSLLADIQEIMEHSDCKLDFFVCLRHLCRSISVDRNEAHETRGIAVPHAWLDELLQWVLNPSNECQLRPIDTFSYVIERGDGDWEVRQEDVDVVPEALFDFFSLCFGSDIRHPCYGSFSRKDQLILANPEAICRVEVSFVLPDGTRIETPCRETTVKAPLTEVIRCAFFSQSDRHDSLLSLECAICAYASLGTSEILEVRMCHNSGCVEPSDSSICSSGEVALRDLVTTPVGKFESTGDHRAIHVLGLEVHFVPSKDEQNPTTHFDLVENRGLCGLYNLGNTCYMNSALQCLSHLDAFRDGLMSLPVSEIPRAHVTTELIALLCGMWSGVNKVARAQNLKLAVSKKSNRFSGYDQEDASEFLEILLDCIHDELNLVTTRKYRQREDSDSTIAAQVLSDIYWADFLENNRSFIPPLLFQQTKTTLTCAQCSHCSVVYDSNLTLSVNIVEPPTLTMVNVHLSVDALSSCGQGSGLVSQVAPISQYVTVELSVRVAQQQDGNLYRVDVEDALNYKLRTSLTLFDSIKEVAGDDCVMEDCRDAWVCSLLCPDVLARDCGTLYAMARQRRPADNEALAKKSVQAVEVWFFAQTPGGHSLVTVEEVLIDLRSDTKSEKSVESSWCDIVVKRAQEVAEAVQKSNNVIPLYGNDVLQPEDLSPIVVTGFADPPSTIHDAPHSLSGIECGLNLGSLMSYDNITEDVIQDWVRLSAEIDAGPVRQFCVVVGDGGFGWRTQSEQFRLRHWSDRQQLWGCGSDDEKGCTLAECVESTFVREVLAGSDEWYCPECKTHREATMERSLFRLPPCLFITLKRFKSQLFRTTKINRVVSLPQRCDFSQFLDATVRERTPAMYYRLQSVVYHSGSLSFGHYTARARRGGADGQWAHFNDAFVTHEPDDTFLDDGAFVLMYQLDNADIEE